MSVAFKELAGSPVETFGPDGMTARRTLLCAWADRRRLVEQLLGDGYEFGGNLRAVYPGSPSVVAMQARCEPIGDDVEATVLTELTEGLNAYTGFAKVTADYEYLPVADRNDLPAVEAGTCLGYRQQHDYETLPLSGDSFTWEDEPAQAVPEEAVPVIRVPLVEHRLTWHRVVSPPWQAIRETIGTVNDGTFLGAAAGTVLLDGVDARREFLRVDDLAEFEVGWRLEYVFRERSIKTGDGTIVGYNHAYRSLPAGDPDWDRLIDGNGNLPYATADFDALFRFEESFLG